MPIDATTKSPDPLAAWTAGIRVRDTATPIPLVSTAYDVRILGGLALVATRRVFRNAEAGSIEATLTFPVPVHAVLFGLRATIDGRTLTATAEARTAARETYETAIDTGRTAVLHEEALRGVHMLSVAHIPPGAEVAVVDRWVVALTALGRDGLLRIPVTVGDVYGRTPLPDSDALVGGGPVAAATVTVTADSGRVVIDRRPAGAGDLSVPLTRPIDIRVQGWVPRPLVARVDDRPVRVTVEPAEAGAAPLDCDILVDESGSMNEAGLDGRTKHAAVLAGIRAAAADLRATDVVRLWRFDDSHALLGTATGPGELRTLAGRLRGPAGGTEIGAALAGVAARPETRTVLIVTDGKSYALDVQALAATGRRFVVVLVGEDSLEANVGHLAALTGGEIFAAASEDTERAVAAAITAARDPVEPRAAKGSPDRFVCGRAGMRIAVEPAASAEDADADPAAVAAFVAGLMLPRLDPEAATALAVRHGLVTHLTSLVLVDEAGAVAEGLPATRKVLLPEFSAAVPARAMSIASRACMPEAAPAPAPVASAGGHRSLMRRMFRAADGDLEIPAFLRRSDSAAPGRRTESLAERIPWSNITDPARIDAELPPDLIEEIDACAADPAIRKVASAHGLEPRRLVLGLLAHSAARSRHAQRLARRILRSVSQADIERLCARLP